MTVRALADERASRRRPDAVVSEAGRFELTGLPAGPVPAAARAPRRDAAAFATPTFEI